MEQDLISIVVPVYRAENYIEETLDCVRTQTYTNWELLLIEDCGPDRSRQLIEEYIRRTGDRRIRLLTHPTNLGAARARNLGVNEAQGRYLAYLDADDLWVPEKLERELAFMKEHERNAHPGTAFGEDDVLAAFGHRATGACACKPFKRRPVSLFTGGDNFGRKHECGRLRGA